MNNSLSKRLAGVLSGYMFDKVFNEPYRAHNLLYVLRSLTPDGSILRKLRTSDYSLSMPSLEHYRVYALDSNIEAGLQIPTDRWMSLQQLQNTTKLRMQAFTKKGLHLFSSRTFVTRMPTTDRIVLAVKSSALANHSNLQLNTISLQHYFDPASPSGVVVSCTDVLPATPRSALVGACMSASAVFINGYLMRNITNSLTFDDGDQVEMITDSSYATSFEMDIASQSDRVNYISNIDNIERSVIHIPKSTNPDNMLISAEFCDFYLFPRNTLGKNERGVKLFMPDNFQARNVTHNDIGISNVALNAAMAMLRVDEAIVKAFIRRTSNNRLIDERNYIKQLYTHTDAEILSHLEGTEQTFWSAQSLEESSYCQFFIDTPDAPSWENVDEHVRALGPYATIDLVAARQKSFTISTSRDMMMSIPVIIDRDNVYVVAYLNGKLLPASSVSWEIMGNEVKVSILPSQVVYTNDVVTCILHDSTRDQVVLIEPSLSNSHFPRNFSSFRLYRVTQNSTGVSSFDKLCHAGYEDLSSNLPDFVQLTKVGSDQYIQFKPSTFGQRFLIVFENGFSRETFDLDDIIADESPLVIDLTTKVTDIRAASVNQLLSIHTGFVSSNGEAISPGNVVTDAIRPDRQAWHLFSGKPAMDAWAERYVIPRTLLPVNFEYNLDVSQQSLHTLIGYRIGFLANKIEAIDSLVTSGYIESASEPIMAATIGTPSAVARVTLTKEMLLQQIVSWEILVDGVVVDVDSNEDWTDSRMDSRAFLLDQAILVNDTVTFRAVGSNSDLITSISAFSPIFASDGSYLEKVPALGRQTHYIHLNGHRLVEGIDYMILRAKEGQQVYSSQLIVQNKQYLKPSGNELDIITTRDITMDITTTLYTGSRLNLNSTAVDSVAWETSKNSYLWLKNLTQITIDGLLVPEVVDEMNRLQLKKVPLRQGGLVGMTTSVSKNALEYIKSSFSDSDVVTLNAVRQYFREDDTLSTIPTEGTYRLYSSSVTWIMHDVLNGMSLPFDPDPTRTVANLPEYEAAIAVDIARTIELNRNYFTIDPCITDTVNYSDPSVIQLMQGVTL